MSATGLLLRAAAAQLIAVALLWLLRGLLGPLAVGWWLLLLALLAGCAAAALALPRWWWWLSAGLLPAVWLAQAWQLPAAVYAAALLLSLLLFGAVFRSRVPLWLSGRLARQRLLELIPESADWQVADLGAGLGGVLAMLHRQRPRLRGHGCEWAWLPYLIGALRLRLVGYRGGWSRGSFWQLDLGRFDLVFAYLSPAPMPELWAKACSEMRPGSRLVSYRFAVPGVTPEQVLAVGAGEDALFVYWPAGRG